MRTGARPRLVEGLLLRPNARGEPGLVRDNGGVERGEFRACSIYWRVQGLLDLGGWSGFRSEVG